jgi:[acyl-carrier-protein] S-malonyltransferase
VRWTESVQYMLAQGIDTFVEVGPGKILTGLMKKTDREVACFPVENQESIDALAGQLGR